MSIHVMPNQDTLEKYLALAKGFCEQGDLSSAVSAYEQLLTHQPSNVSLLLRLTTLLFRLDRLQEALVYCKTGHQLDPDNVQLINLLALIFQKHGVIEPVEKLLISALDIDPNDAASASNLASFYINQKKITKAKCFAQHAVSLMPNDEQALINMGIVFSALGDSSNAHTVFGRAISNGPTSPIVFYQHGNFLKNCGDTNSSIDAYRNALLIQPDFSPARAALGMQLLLINCYREGFAEYEYRLQVNEMGFQQPHELRQWCGGTLYSGGLLIVAEQGLGDQIFCLRFAAELCKRCVRVYWQVPKVLKALFTEQYPDVCFVDTASQPMQASHYCPLMSLFSVLAIDAEEGIRKYSSFAYMSINGLPQESLQSWNEHRKQVGIVWRGNPNHTMDQERSIAFSQIRGFIERIDIDQINCDFISLQYDSDEQELLPPWAQQTDTDHDFSDTAQYIAELDLVISVDTAVVHLAAAMGKPCWLLLAYSNDWRWGINTTQTSWYPSVQLYRQPSRRDWASVFESIETDLKKFC